MTGMTTHEASDKTVSKPTCYQAAEDFHTKGVPAQLPGALEHTAVSHSEYNPVPCFFYYLNYNPHTPDHRYDRSIEACPVL